MQVVESKSLVSLVQVRDYLHCCYVVYIIQNFVAYFATESRTTQCWLNQKELVFRCFGPNNHNVTTNLRIPSNNPDELNFSSLFSNEGLISISTTQSDCVLELFLLITLTAPFLIKFDVLKKTFFKNLKLEQPFVGLSDCITN